MNKSGKKSQPVAVYIRQRPFTNAEVESKCVSMVHKMTSHELTIKSGFTEKNYKFDHVFGGDASQGEVYKTVVAPLLDYTISGYNCTAFAYGQTGTGKTYTIMGGNLADSNAALDNSSWGLIPRAATQLFTELAKLPVKTEYSVRISFIEIYNEEVRDLLQESIPVRVYDDPHSKGSVYMKDLSEVTACNVNSVLQWLNIGLLARQTAATNLNAQSSRSHTIFTFLVNTREITSTGDELIKIGKLHLVDLAGSENIGRSGATNVRVREAGTINRSLLTLGKVIKAIAQKMQHIPYRDSKLTRILQDSLGGSTKTCMIATFSSRINAWEETQSTLEYALLARNVANCPIVNVCRKQADIVNEFQVEIDKLKHELQVARSGTGFYISSEHYEQMSEENKNNYQQILNLIQEIRTLEDYKQTKTQEYETLVGSFEETKVYLEQVKKELEEKTRIVEQNYKIVNYMQDRDDKMTKNLDQLLKFCETATTHKNIYHEKLDKQRHATTDNANISQQMVASSLNALKEIQDVSKQQNSSTDTRISEAREEIDFLNGSYMEGLEQNNDFSKKIQEYLDSRIIQSEKLLINPKSRQTYSDENNVNFSVAIYNDLLELNDLSQLNAAIDHLNQCTISRNTDLKKKSIGCCNTIGNEIAKIEEYLQFVKSLLDRITTDYAESRNSVQQRTSIDLAFKKTLLEYIEKSDEETNRLGEQLAQLKKLTEKVICTTKSYDEEQIGPKIKDSLGDYMQCQSDTVSLQRLTASEIAETVKGQEIELQNQIKTSKSNVANYFTEVTNTIKENLNTYNTEFKNVIRSWISKANQMNDTTFKPAISKTENIRKNIDLISQDQTQYNAEIDGIVQISSTNLESLKDSISFTTHVGDTPVKTNIIYPKRVTDLISPAKIIF